MKTDKTTRVLLAVIVVGLWANVINPWINSKPAYAYGDDHSAIMKVLKETRDPGAYFSMAVA